MTIETSANFISELNENYPKREDLIKEGDDHLRLIKSVLKNSFPNVDSQVTASSTNINRLTDAITATAAKNVTFQGSVKFTPGESVNFNTVSPVGLGTPASSTSPITLGYFKTELMKLIYPVGSIYITTAGSNPSVLLGIGTWEAYAEGRVLMGYGTGTDAHGDSLKVSNGETGGYYQIKLNVNDLPSHHHEVSINKTISGGNHRHVFCADSNASDGPLSSYDIKKIASNPVGGATGGAYMGFYKTSDEDHSHTLSVDTNTGSVGGGDGHYNVQPYVGVKIWRRVS